MVPRCGLARSNLHKLEDGSQIPAEILLELLPDALDSNPDLLFSASGLRLTLIDCRLQGLDNPGLSCDVKGSAPKGDVEHIAALTDGAGICTRGK